MKYAPDTYPLRAQEPLKKPPKGAAKKSRRRDSRKRKTAEIVNKGDAKARDGHRCRFPLCQCRRMGRALHASHQRHKGIWGNPAGDRSTPNLLITLCSWRHQNGTFSRHAGTLRAVPLTRKGCNGPVKWEIDVAPLWDLALTSRAFAAILHTAHVPGNGVVEVAREYDVQKILPLAPWQRSILERLAMMDL